MITAAIFRSAFPEFNNPVQYPDAGIGFWITQAYNQLSARRFGASLDLAAMLFVAHNMVLSAQAALTAATTSGVVGLATGLLNSKSVGGVSAGYDTGATVIEGAGAWNGTSYGQRLYKMMQTFTGATYVPGRARGAGVGRRLV